jgi:hypothetical protein
MKKIGTTATGSVIVEMASEEYEALERLQRAGPGPAPASPSGPVVGAPVTHADRTVFVADRLRKLSPKKREGVVRSIKTMFQFAGGIEDAEVDEIIVTLQKQKFFAIAPDGKVTYSHG